MRVLESAFSTGDSHVMRATYDRYGQLIFSMCRRQIDDHTATAVALDVFVTAWNQRDLYDPDCGGLAPWLADITRHKVATHQHTTGHTASHGSAVRDLQAPSLSTTEQFDEMVLRMLLVDAIETLSKRPQMIVSLAFFDRLRPVEIAARSGIPLETVESDIQESLVRLAREVSYRRA